MTVKIEKGKAKGTFSAPPSKSMAHRNLICAAFTEKSTVRGVSFSEDIRATLSCLEALGADIQVDGDVVTLGGIGRNPIKKSELFCNESGSTLRFMIPLCLMRDESITLSGSQRLFERPNKIYADICEKQCLHFEQTENGISVRGRLSSGEFVIPGDVSSQFISGLMFVLPLLERDSIITLTGKIESRSYIFLTLKALSDFGVHIEQTSYDTYYIKGGQSYENRDVPVEGDYSNAAFFEALNYFGGEVEIKGLDEKSLQGDRVYTQLFPLLEKGRAEIDISDCPDLAPVLFVLAAAKNGGIFTGTRRLKIKESDRAAVMKEELSKFGIGVIVDENSVEVEKGELKAPEEILRGHNDHRIVMALSVLCTLTGGSIEEAESVRKSFPDFFERLRETGIDLTQVIL
ncbi:MAG: 3-phosphoshikimate 1-carboxyvinyltransferase [Clostridia bacterium]|nr:3-phosphoshikimate 1-carboxyvinyltransferase [Clostridia bacterium]